MGLCHEFGTQIREGCGHPMQAGQTACACPECGTVCHGLFEGCPDVWERGPRPVMVSAKPDDVIDGVAPREQPATVVNAPSAVLRAAEAETERILAAETDRALAHAGAALGAGAPRAQQARARANFDPDRRAAAQVEADRAAAQTGPAEPTAGPGGGAHPDGPEATGSGPAANGRPALGAGTPPSSPDPRTDVLRWFEEAFAGLRRDLREVVTGMTQQQAMIAELMDARQADLRLVVVAEGLPDVVQDAVEAAVADHTAELSETLETALAQLRQSVKDTDSASATAVAELRGAVEASESASATAVAELRGAVEASERSAAAAVEASERSAAAALEEARRLQDEAEQREALRARALKASFTRQLGPLAEALQRVVETTDRRMDGINARLDAMAMPAGPARPATKKAATKRAAPAKKAPAKKAPAKKAPATRSSTAKTATTKAAVKAAPARAVKRRVLSPAPAPTPLAARRQPLRGLRPLEERR